MSRAREKKETKIAHDTQQRTEKKNDTQKVDDEVSARARLVACSISTYLKQSRKNDYYLKTQEIHTEESEKETRNNN